MYYKIVNEQQIFSDCKTIQNEDGSWTSNPTAEMIAAAGWLEYIPPEVLPIPELEPHYMDIINAVKKMLKNSTTDLSDEEALEVSALYTPWIEVIGEQVNVGERYWYDGKLYKVIQAHTVQDDWTPDTATSLFVEVSIEEWPEFVQPTGNHDAYNTGDKMTFEGQHYISLIDNNVWSPAAHAAGWKLVA